MLLHFLWNESLKHKRQLFIEELGLGLVSHQLDFRSKNSNFLNEDIRNGLTVVGYPVVRNVPITNENSTQCFDCSAFVCNEHPVKRSFFCSTCCK